MTGEAADVNKDDVVTAAEAFDYAHRQVAASYKSEVALRPSTRASLARKRRRSQSRGSAGSALSGADPEVAALRAQRGEIEHDLDGVKERKTALSQDEVLRRARRRAGEARAAAEADRFEAGGAMMQRLAQALVTLFAALAAGSSLAQSIDYDPRRAPELRACDDHQHRGRVEQARACYSQLVNSPNPIMQREAYWALGDLQRANECFRDFTRANARAVQPRIRWAGCSCRRISTTMPPSCFAMH